MPLVYQQNINVHTKLGVWHIAEPEDFFLEKVPLQNTITHPHKRLQHLAGRLVLSELYEDFPIKLIQVASTKKPYLPDEAFHFSISHCAGYAAAIVSRQNRVGVDIETPQPKIALIKNKFLKENEQQMLQQLNIDFLQALTMAWSVKETLFKWYALGNVDFKENLHILSARVNDNQFLFDCVFQKQEAIPLKVKGIFFNSNCLTWLST